ncbi:MAG TPA: potassium transporter TrkG [Actinomycetales bacterium]|nr:potassium transporter TrkG [Actinomycetales bacterium]
MGLTLPRPLLAARDYVDYIARRAPARLAVVIFAAVIGVITLLLRLPAATVSGKSANFVDALFTATSAVCVTGLTTVPTATFWSGFGQAVILIGIKIGGLGVLTLASLLGMAVSRRLGLTQRILAASETKAQQFGEVGALVRIVVLASVTVELFIAALLTPRFLSLGFDFPKALWHGVFYAVSAFNNAGFVSTPDGLFPYATDWLLTGPIMIAAFIGALGFPVIMTLARKWRHPHRWNLHTRLTITTSLALVAVGAILITALEWSNSATLGELSIGDKIHAGLFQGIMPRSAGLTTVNVGSMNEGTWLVTDALMFVGGGSASTAGGIKVTTFAVMLLAIRAEARGDRDIEAWGRRIPSGVLRLSVAVVFVGATLVLISSLILLAMTNLTLDVVLFEVISAFATCGLSTGITADLPDSGKYVLTGLMFVGRTGTMTVAAALALRNRQRVIRLPKERPIVG